MEELKIRKLLIKITNFPVLLAVFISYAVGAGLVSYLGKTINWQKYWLGICIVILFILSAEYLSAFYHYWNQKIKSEFQKNKKIRTVFLQSGLTTLTIGAVFTVLIIAKGFTNSVVWLFLILFFLINCIFVIPPFELKEKGYGELIHAVNITVLSPAFALVLQNGDLHPTLMLLTFPSTFLLISMFLAFSLEHYFSDIKSNNNTLMTRLGWKTGMNIHNLFIMLTYVIYGIVVVLGFPWRLALPAAFSLPFAMLQLWEMIRINEGVKPRWNLLKLSSVASVSVLAYFLLFTLWFR